jgi:hypothetical protein
VSRLEGVQVSRQVRLISCSLSVHTHWEPPHWQLSWHVRVFLTVTTPSWPAGHGWFSTVSVEGGQILRQVSSLVVGVSVQTHWLFTTVQVRTVWITM